jgi:hypothetical protein
LVANTYHATALFCYLLDPLSAVVQEVPSGTGEYQPDQPEKPEGPDLEKRRPGDHNPEDGHYVQK